MVMQTAFPTRKSRKAAAPTTTPSGWVVDQGQIDTAGKCRSWKIINPLGEVLGDVTTKRAALRIVGLLSASGSNTPGARPAAPSPPAPPVDPARLYELGFRAVEADWARQFPRFGPAYHLHKPEGGVLCIHPAMRLCNCCNSNSAEYGKCPHLLGLPALLAAQADAESVAA